MHLSKMHHLDILVFQIVDDVEYVHCFYAVAILELK